MNEENVISLEEFWKIKNGDYIRTKKGLIGKFEAYADNYYINGCNSNYFEHFIDRKDIKSHSKNIIDLIEVGDIVNGIEIIDIDNLEGEIKSIVTKEQFKEMEYRIDE